MSRQAPRKVLGILTRSDLLDAHRSRIDAGKRREQAACRRDAARRSGHPGPSLRGAELVDEVLAVARQALLERGHSLGDVELHASRWKLMPIA